MGELVECVVCRQQIRFASCAEFPAVALKNADGESVPCDCVEWRQIDFGDILNRGYAGDMIGTYPVVHFHHPRLRIFTGEELLEEKEVGESRYQQ